MHKLKAKFNGCTIYWDGKYLCVHRNGTGVHHIANTMDEAFEIAKKIGKGEPTSNGEIQEGEGE